MADYTLELAPDSYALSGQLATVLAGRSLVAAPGEYLTVEYDAWVHLTMRLAPSSYQSLGWGAIFDEVGKEFPLLLAAAALEAELDTLVTFVGAGVFVARLAQDGAAPAGRRQSAVTSARWQAP